MPIAPNALQAGSEWDLGAVGVRMRQDSTVSVGGESCVVFADTGTRKDTHLRITFCPQAGYLAKLEYEGQYQEFGATIHEKVTLELTGIHHKELSAQWLGDAEAQLGVLMAYLEYSAPIAPAQAQVMDGTLKNGSPAAQAL